MPIPIYAIDERKMKEELIGFLTAHPNIGYTISELRAQFFPNSQASRICDETVWIEKCISETDGICSEQIPVYFIRK